MIEAVFAEMGESLNVFSVSTRGGLPSPDLVHAKNSIVKMHGSLHETRADNTLDEEPLEKDYQRFHEYLLGPRHPPGAPVPSFGSPAAIVRRPPACLLVCGYSAGDERCNLLMQRHLNSSPDKVAFWVCYSAGALEKLQDKFRDQITSGQLLVTITERLDLLLSEFYQYLVLSLPRGGLSYQSTHNVPPENGLKLDPPLSEPAAKAASEQIHNFISKAPSDYVTVTYPGGLQKILRKAFEDYASEKNLQKIWLELEDFTNTSSVAHTLFQIIALRRGKFQLDHSILVPKMFVERFRENLPHKDVSTDDWEKHLRALILYLNIEPSEWLLVFYGRYGPGGCAGWKELEFWPNDKAFTKFLRALHKVNFHVIYAPYEETRQEYDRRRADQIKATIALQTTHPLKAGELLETPFSAGTGLRPHHADKPPFPMPPLPGAAPLDGAVWPHFQVFLKWLYNQKDSYFWKMAYGITLFRQSRRYAAFLSAGMIPCPDRFNSNGVDNDVKRQNQLTVFLDKLDECKLIFRKPGGFAWAYKDFRIALRVALETQEEIPGCSPAETFAGGRSEQHFWIADWYMKAFYASGHADSLVEALFHYRYCALHAEHIPNRLHGRHFWCFGVAQMARALDVGHSSLHFWLGMPRLSALFERHVDLNHPDGPLGEVSHVREKLYQGVSDGVSRELLDSLTAHWNSLVTSSEDLAGRERYRGFNQFAMAKVVPPRPSPQPTSSSFRKAFNETVGPLQSFPQGEENPFVESLLKLAFDTSPLRQTDNALYAALRQLLFESLGGAEDFNAIVRQLQRTAEWSYLILRRAKREEVLDSADRDFVKSASRKWNLG